MNINKKLVSELIPYEFNNKIHNEGQIDKIANSINEFGFTQPIVIDKNNVIVAGHGRREASKKLGLQEVPVVLVDNLTEPQIKKYRLLDNKLSSMVEYDLGNIKIELQELDDPELNDLFEYSETEEYPDIDFDNIESNADRSVDENKRTIMCPDCGFKFDI